MPVCEDRAVDEAADRALEPHRDLRHLLAMTSLEVVPVDLRSTVSVQRSQEPFSELAGIVSAVELPEKPRASSAGLAALSDRLVTVLLEIRRVSTKHSETTLEAADVYEDVERQILRSLRA